MDTKMKQILGNAKAVMIAAAMVLCAFGASAATATGYGRGARINGSKGSYFTVTMPSSATGTLSFSWNKSGDSSVYRFYCEFYKTTSPTACSCSNSEKFNTSQFNVGNSTTGNISGSSCSSSGNNLNGSFPISSLVNEFQKGYYNWVQIYACNGGTITGCDVCICLGYYNSNGTLSDYAPSDSPATSTYLGGYSVGTSATAYIEVTPSVTPSSCGGSVSGATCSLAGAYNGANYIVKVTGLTAGKSYTFYPVMNGSTMSTSLNFTAPASTVASSGYASRVSGGTSFKMNDSCVDIHGKGGVKTTYANAGWASKTTDGVDVFPIPSIVTINNRDYVNLKYIVRKSSSSASVSSAKVGINADIMIGSNDRAPVYKMEYGLRTAASTAANALSFASLTQKGTDGLAAQIEKTASSRWFGYWSYRSANTFVNTSATSMSGSDSGAAVSWQNLNLSSGAPQTVNVIIGVADKLDIDTDAKGNGTFEDDPGTVTPSATIETVEGVSVREVGAYAQGSSVTAYFQVAAGTNPTSNGLTLGSGSVSVFGAWNGKDVIFKVTGLSAGTAYTVTCGTATLEWTAPAATTTSNVTGGYYAKSAGGTAWRLSGTTRIDVQGASKVKTTYSNAGWTLKENKSGTLAWAVPSIETVNGRDYAVLTYYVRNTSASAISDYSFGANADIMIGPNDHAPVYKENYGLRTAASTAANALSFALITQKGDGIAEYAATVSSRWFGYYGQRSANQFVNTSSSSVTGIDSGAAFAWQHLTLNGGETISRSFVIGVAGKDQVETDVKPASGADPTYEETSTDDPGYVAPSEDVTPVTPPAVPGITRVGTTVTISPTITGVTYTLYDEDGNELGTATGTGDALEFTGIDTSKSVSVTVVDPATGAESHVSTPGEGSKVKVGDGSYYASVEDAIAAAKTVGDDVTITLIDDISPEEVITIACEPGQTITIDLGGRTVGGAGFKVTGDEGQVIFTNGSIDATVAVNGNVTIDDAKVKAVTVDDGATLSVTGDSKTGFDPSPYLPSDWLVVANTDDDASTYDYKTLSLSDALAAGYVARIGNVGYMTIAAAVAAAHEGEAAESPTTIKLLLDTTENVTIPNGRCITLDLNDRVLKGDGTTSVIYNNGTLTIIDSAEPKTARYWDKDSDSGLWTLASDQSTATDFVTTGGCITCGIGRNDDYGNKYGGGVWNSGTLTLSSGNVCGNSATFGAGGVYVNSGGIFTMTGGTISGNVAKYNGGGVCNSGLFTMNGGVISGNTGRYGGGVENWEIMIVNDGEISDNTAGYSGGGVDNSNATFTMNGGIISGNTVTGTDDGGGGVHNGAGTFNLNGGKIVGNTAGSGGGVCNVFGTFTMTDGEISGNVGDYCGGVYNSFDSTFTMTGGCITGNSGIWGGGICNGGDLTLKDCFITNNHCRPIPTKCDYMTLRKTSFRFNFDGYLIAA